MNRKKISTFFVLMSIIITLKGCVETTEIDLNTSPSQLVVEGEIAEGEHPYVLLSLSGSFYSTKQQFVEDALVKIEDDAGNKEQLEYQGDGKYITKAFLGTPGRKYHLEITHNNQYYEAWTTMPQPPKIDEIEVTYYQESILREAGYYIAVKGIDVDVSNGYYRLLIHKNGKLINPLGTEDLFVSIADEVGNGIQNMDIPFPFKTQDDVKIEIVKMDKAAYLFYQSYLLLLLNDGGLFGSPPTNPESNISNGALGFFQAIVVLEKDITIEH